MTTQLLHIAALISFGMGLGVIGYVLAATPATVAPVLGERGKRRSEALAEPGLFARLEPLIRKVAGWLSRVRFLDRVRPGTEDALRRASYVLGLTADELFAIMVLTGLGGWGAGYVLCVLFGEPVYYAFMGLVVGALLPRMQLEESRKERFKKVDRGLPPAIDLVALCMGAGSDFPSAIRFVVQETPDERDPVREELVHILQQLSVGHTRSTALRHFAHRVPTDAVRDFSSAVVQAEEKGTPLAEVLGIQAKMLRMRRSVKAEEAAARAGILLIGPLMLLLCAILVVLFGPLGVNGIGF